MEASSPWVVIILAIIGSFGGAPLFKYLAERVRGNVAQSEKHRLAFEKEKEKFELEKSQFWAERRRDAQSLKLENQTYRDAMNDLLNQNGWLKGQLERCVQERTEAEAEIVRLRNRKGPAT